MKVEMWLWKKALKERERNMDEGDLRRHAEREELQGSEFQIQPSWKGWEWECGMENGKLRWVLTVRMTIQYATRDVESGEAQDLAIELHKGKWWGFQ